MDDGLREELLAMQARDQETRSNLLETGGLFDGFDEDMEIVHR